MRSNNHEEDDGATSAETISQERYDRMNQSSSSNFLMSVIRRMHPSRCLKNDSVSNEILSDENFNFQKLIPPLIEKIYLPKDNETSEGYGELRISALRQLYELTVSKNANNRIPLVCTCKWDVIAALAYSIAHSDNEISSEDNNDQRRIACLTLNNLSVPFENKAVMTLGVSSDVLIASLTQVINLQLPQSYLCCICLMNLTYLDDAVSPVLYFSPKSEITKSNIAVSKRLVRLASKQKQLDSYWNQEQNTCDKVSQIDNKKEKLTSSSPTLALVDPYSLISSIQRIIKIFAPFLKSEVESVEREAIRWSLGFLRNITKEEHCILILKTEIPPMIISFIETSSLPILEWIEDSVEESALLIMCNIAKWKEGRVILKRHKAHKAVDKIIGHGGIHDIRASIIQASLTSTNTSI